MSSFLFVFCCDVFVKYFYWYILIVHSTGFHKDCGSHFKLLCKMKLEIAPSIGIPTKLLTNLSSQSSFHPASKLISSDPWTVRTCGGLLRLRQVKDSHKAAWVILVWAA